MIILPVRFFGNDRIAWLTLHARSVLSLLLASLDPSRTVCGSVHPLQIRRVFHGDTNFFCSSMDMFCADTALQTRATSGARFRYGIAAESMGYSDRWFFVSLGAEIQQYSMNRLEYEREQEDIVKRQASSLAIRSMVISLDQVVIVSCRSIANHRA